MAILIQHLKSAKTLGDMSKVKEFVAKDLLYVLYQVYMTLSSLSDAFTHYDLHRDNVLVYEPVVGSHIEYHYHLENGTETVFKSKYIAKIIDYGRCYYNDLDSDANTSNSKLFYDNIVCKECKPMCGIARGYGWMDYKANQMKQSSFICSQRLNPSHDLRLLYTIGKNVDGMDPKLESILKRVVYGKGVAKGKGMYGTEPNPKSGLPSKINNVKDAFSALAELANLSQEMFANDVSYHTSKKLGELHIYGKKMPMRWVASKV
jgi:hypothetical protein